jgi:hypothetical protein
MNNYMNALRILLIGLATLLSNAPAASAADAKRPAALTPGGKWARHDLNRPRPPVVNPGPAGEPVRPPSDAIVLFDGKDFRHWQRQPRKGDPDSSPEPKWKLESGYMEVAPRTGGIQTTARFGDCQLHLEWATPGEVKGSGQGRGNSGIMLQGFGEVQVLDSYENDTYPDGQAGAIYGRHPPLVNASRPPGQWQTYDIVLRTARLDADHQVIEPARLTVFHNGILIHHAVELDSRQPDFSLALQDHNDLVRYRNIWLRPVKEYDEP